MVDEDDLYAQGYQAGYCGGEIEVMPQGFRYYFRGWRDGHYDRERHRIAAAGQSKRTPGDRDNPEQWGN